MQLRVFVLAVASALAGSVVSSERPASAEVAITPLSGLDATSKTIVIARVTKAFGPAYPATGWELSVERTLRGAVAPATTVIVRPAASGHAHFPVGTRLVAFIDGSTSWVAAATVAAGPSLEDGVLRLDGFSDFDAHWITPGVMTLAMLESYLKGTALSWTFRGKLELAGAAGPTASTIDITTTGAAASWSVSGLPALAGFPAPTVHPGPWMGNDLEIEWERGLSRPLTIVGEVAGKNPDGSIAMRYRLDEPRALTEADFRKYAGDASLGHPYYVIDVALADGTHATLQLGRDIGRVGELTAPGGGPLRLTGLSMAPARNVTAAGVTIALDPRTPAFTPQRTGAEGELVQELLAGPVGCTWTKGGASQKCTLGRVTTKFATK